MDFKEIAERKGPSAYRGIVWTVVLAAALCLMLFGIVRMWSRSLGPQEQEAEQPARQEEALPDRKAGHAESTAIRAAVEGEPEPKEKKLPHYLTDPATLKEPAASAAIDSYSFYYLLYQAKIADVKKLAADARPAGSAEQMVQWEPGAAVSLAGTILSIEPRTDLNIPSADIPQAIQYEIEDAKEGNRYLVFTVYEVNGITTGDQVNVTGRYLRLYPHPRAGDGGEARQVPTPIIVARELDGSRYATDPSCLKAVNDGTFSHEPKAFFYLANRVKGMSEEELKKLADETLTPEALLREPAAARGRPVVVDGAVIVTQPVDESPNIAGIEHFYWTIIRSREGPGVWLYTLEEPKGFQKRDPVRAYGLFLKTRRYTSGGYEREALIVVARQLAGLEFPESSGLGWVMVVIGAVVLGFLVVAAALERRKSREFSRHVRHLSAKARPEHIDATARAIASRTRRAKDRVTAPARKGRIRGSGDVE